MRIFGSERISGLMLPPGHGGGRPDRARDGHEVDRARAEAGGGAELLDPQAPARVRRRDEQAAPRRSTTCAAWSSRARTPASTCCGLVDEIVEWYVDSYCSEKDEPRPTGTSRACRARSRRPSASRCRLPELRGIGRGEMVPKLAERVRGALRGARAADRRRADALPPAHDHAADRRHAVEGPPVLARPPEGGHRPARLRPARPARRVQEGILPDVPGAHGPDRRGDPALDLPLPAGARRPRRRRARGAARPPARAREPELAWPASARRGTSRSTTRRRRRPSRAAEPREARAAGRGPDGPREGRRSAATTPARAAAARSTKSVRTDPARRAAGRPQATACPCGSGKKYKKCHGS